MSFEKIRLEDIKVQSFLTTKEEQNNYGGTYTELCIRAGEELSKTEVWEDLFHLAEASEHGVITFLEGVDYGMHLAVDNIWYNIYHGSIEFGNLVVETWHEGQQMYEGVMYEISANVYAWTHNGVTYFINVTTGQVWTGSNGGTTSGGGSGGGSGSSGSSGSSGTGNSSGNTGSGGFGNNDSSNGGWAGDNSDEGGSCGLLTGFVTLQRDHIPLDEAATGGDPANGDSGGWC